MANIIDAIRGTATAPEPRPGTIKTLLARNPEVAERLSTIAHKDEAGHDHHMTAANRLRDKQEAKREAVAAKAHHDADYGEAPVLNDLDTDGNPIDPGIDEFGGQVETVRGRHTSRSFIAGLDARIALATREAQIAEQDVQRSSADWTPWSRLHGAAKGYLSFYAQTDGHNRVALNRPAVTLKKGESIADFAARKEGEATSVREVLTSTERSYPPAEQAKAALLADVDKRSAAPRAIIPNMANRRVARQPYIKWAIEPLIGVESSNTQLVPSIDDALGALIWLHRDALVEALNQQVDAAYAGFEARGILVLDRHERDARASQLKSDLLAIEHGLAEAIWQTGGPFPPGLDLRAILGIDGPEPKPLGIA